MVVLSIVGALAVLGGAFLPRFAQGTLCQVNQSNIRHQALLVSLNEGVPNEGLDVAELVRRGLLNDRQARCPSRAERAEGYEIVLRDGRVVDVRCKGRDGHDLPTSAPAETDTRGKTRWKSPLWWL
jgi:hypothetical protein